jgi:hypothetical protein
MVEQTTRAERRLSIPVIGSVVVWAVAKLGFNFGTAFVNDPQSGFENLPGQCWIKAAC